MAHHPTFITCSSLSFSWPDGTEVLDDFRLTVGPGRTGLVGLNGSGKSTLLKLLAGELTPASGAIRVTGELGYLPQNLVLDTSRRVDEILGIAGKRAALHAIEAGDPAEEHFTALADDWDVEERARATLDQLGLTAVGLDRTVGEVSGGESVLLRLAALLLARPDVLLLDEPTNNLDLHARARLYEAVEGWSGVLVVVSHDRELLERVDQIADLRDGEVTWYGGPWSAYETALAAEQDAAERMVRVAEADVQRQKRELGEAQTKLARRKRFAQKSYENKVVPKIVANGRKSDAQVAAGKHRTLHTERLSEAKERLDAAVEAVRDDDEIRVELPRTSVPPGREVLFLRDLELRYGARVDGEFALRGPERIALVGRNGAGEDDAAPDDRRGGGAAVGRGGRTGTAPLPAAAARRPRRRAERGGERGPLRAHGDGERDQGAAGEVSVPGGAGGSARGHPLGRGAVPGDARGAAPGGSRLRSC